MGVDRGAAELAGHRPVRVEEELPGEATGCHMQVRRPAPRHGSIDGHAGHEDVSGQVKRIAGPAE